MSVSPYNVGLRYSTLALTLMTFLMKLWRQLLSWVPWSEGWFYLKIWSFDNLDNLFHFVNSFESFREKLTRADLLVVLRSSVALMRSAQWSSSESIM